MSDEAVDLSEFSEKVTPEQLEELMTNGEGVEDYGFPKQELSPVEKAVAGGLNIVEIPAIIEVEFGGEIRTFYADQFSSWGYTPFGIYAVGRFEDDDEGIVRNRLFNGDKVVSLDLQIEAYKEALEAAIEAEAAEATESEQESGDEPEPETPVEDPEDAGSSD